MVNARPIADTGAPVRFPIGRRIRRVPPADISRGAKGMRHLRWLFVAAAVIAVPQVSAVWAQPVPTAATADAEDARLTAFLDKEFAEDLKLRPQLATRLG